MEQITDGGILLNGGISANWVMALLLTILLIMMKKSSDAADRREKKIDEILDNQQKQINKHDVILATHSERIESFSSDISQSNKDLVESMFNKMAALNFGRKSRYDKE